MPNAPFLQSETSLQPNAGSTPADAAALAPDLLYLLEQMPDGVLLLDREWRAVYANAVGRKISRLPEGDLPQETHWQLYPQSVGSDVERLYRGVMDSRVAAKAEIFYPPFDLWLDIHVVPVPIGIALHYRDITDAKRSEASREAALRQLHQVFEASPDSIVCIDRQWNCSYANSVAAELLRGNPVGKNTWKDLPGNMEEPFYSNYWATMVHRTPTEFEAYYPEPLNIWFKVYARAFDEGIIIFSRNITAAKRAEIQRESTARRLQELFDITSDGICSLDRNWNYTFLNRCAKEMLAEKGDLVGRNFWEEFPAAIDNEVGRQYRRTMDQGLISDFETFYPEPLNRWYAIESRPSDGGIVVFFRDITSRRMAEQTMRQQQELLAVVQSTSHVATWEIDLATRSLTFGPGSYPLYGWPLETLHSADAFRKVVAPHHLHLVIENAANAVATLEPVNVEFEVIGADGEARWVESRAQAVAVDGVPRYLRGIAFDVTARKRNEAVLVASEARYRVLAELSPQGLWMSEPDGRVTYANQGLLDYLGLTLDQLQGLGWADSVPQQQRPLLLETWRTSLVSGQDLEIEVQLGRAADGAFRWWSLRARAVRDDAGAILYWLGVGTDIDATRTTAETLRRQHEATESQRAELETVYETAPIGLALFDPVEFRYLRLNERQAQIVGYPKEYILGKTLTEMAPIEGLREMFESVAAGAPIRNQLLEGSVASSPGDHRYWTVNYFPVYGPDGTVQAITAASLEITQQKRAEAALIQSEKLAAVGRLASSISHEINNPLEAVTNLLYLIAMTQNLPDDMKVYVQMAQSELARVSQIATQTLRFHRQAVSRTSVVAEDLVGAVLNLYQGRLANSHIKVQARYISKTPILCFENDIRQVLNNLIANAIDAMRTGGRLVARAHDAIDAQGRRGVRITIADTGHGMDAKTLARIFEPFYTTKDLNGTGLGLWISEGIVERHKGRLSVRSSVHPVHHGTVFGLFLPLDEMPE